MMILHREEAVGEMELVIISCIAVITSGAVWKVALFGVLHIPDKLRLAVIVNNYLKTTGESAGKPSGFYSLKSCL